MQEDPGRQSMSGSFNPIDVGEWSGQVYVGETEKFFAAISCGDRDALNKEQMFIVETMSDERACTSPSCPTLSRLPAISSMQVRD
jgi:hypothetical protein